MHRVTRFNCCGYPLGEALVTVAVATIVHVIATMDNVAILSGCTYGQMRYRIEGCSYPSDEGIRRHGALDFNKVSTKAALMARNP